MTERSSREGDIDTDLQRNYAPDIALLCKEGIFRGKDEVGESAQRLGLQIPDAVFEYTTVLVEGEFAFLEWRAESADTVVNDGADSYLIHEGRIIAQSIHYTLEEKA